MLSLSVNGVSYSYPETGDTSWGDGSSNWASAVTTGMLQKAGGTFTLTADVDFGANFGLKAIFKSRSSNIADSGILRLANNEGVAWRNAANAANKVLKVNASDQLEYDGATILSSASVSNNTALASNGAGQIVSSSVTDTELGRLSGILSSAVGISDTQTLTNKKLSDSTVTFVDQADATKQFAIQCSGITGGQTRTWTPPDADGTFVGQTNSQTLTNKTISNSENTLEDLDFAGSLRNLSIACSVAANALTIALKDAGGSDCSGTSKAQISFRNSTAGTGTYTLRSVSAALSVVISSGSTLGHRSGVDEYIYVWAIDNSGTVELAVTSSPARYDGGSILSTTAEGGAGAADSRSVIYSTTARANVPARLIARIKSNQATAGTWASTPSEISNFPFSPPPVFRISSIAQSRVTAGAPTALGEYRSYLRTGGGTTFSETNGSPGTAPTAADGFLIYGGNAWANTDTNNEPSKYEIFVGKNKNVSFQFFSTAGFTGVVDTSLLLSGTNTFGCIKHYDPSTGIATVTVLALSVGTAGNFMGVSGAIGGQQDGYFDILVSDTQV